MHTHYSSYRNGIILILFSSTLFQDHFFSVVSAFLIRFVHGSHFGQIQFRIGSSAMTQHAVDHRHFFRFWIRKVRLKIFFIDFLSHCDHAPGNFLLDLIIARKIQFLRVIFPRYMAIITFYGQGSCISFHEIHQAVF